MKLSDFKTHLLSVDELNFVLPNGSSIPKHFHITEVGQVDKRFIDCGGVIREEQVISLQLWESIDIWHRLEPAKLLKIIELSEQKLSIGDFEIDVEYQNDTIGKYQLEFNAPNFVLMGKKTACLATDNCGIPSPEQLKQALTACCTPGGKCC